MILQGIDHIWAVGESFHMREHAPGDGSLRMLRYMVPWSDDILWIFSPVAWLRSMLEQHVR